MEHNVQCQTTHLRGFAWSEISDTFADWKTFANFRTSAVKQTIGDEATHEPIRIIHIHVGTHTNS